jgi:hypothetical protein
MSRIKKEIEKLQQIEEKARLGGGQKVYGVMYGVSMYGVTH